MVIRKLIRGGKVGGYVRKDREKGERKYVCARVCVIFIRKWQIMLQKIYGLGGENYKYI